MTARWTKPSPSFKPQINSTNRIVETSRDDFYIRLHSGMKNSTSSSTSAKNLTSRSDVETVTSRRKENTNETSRKILITNNDSEELVTRYLFVNEI